MLGHLGVDFLVLGLCLQLATAANILAVFAYILPSPFYLVAPLMKALVHQGHQVTIISCGNHLADIDGAHHIRVRMLDHLSEDMFNDDCDWQTPFTKWQEASIIAKYYYNSSSYILSDTGVQALLHDGNAQFDMVIVQASQTDALYGFAQHFNASLVGLSAYATAWNIDFLAGNTAPSIYEPMLPVGYSNGFGLLDKLKNWIYITEEWLVERFIYVPPQVQLYKHYFNQSAESLYKIRHSFSLMLINQHFSLGRARSNVPNVIEVAGMHLDEPSKPLDAELQRFVDEAEHGVILFSLGTDIDTKWLPVGLTDLMQRIFAHLTQRIVWKSDQTLRHKSDNIYISPMLPQRELLAHAKVKLFITHCGTLSTIEGAFHGVPMLCLPLYYDHFSIAERMKLAGVSQTLHYASMTFESTIEVIQELIENPIYTLNAQQMSNRLRDQPMSPLQTAVWWTEYVLRHKGAPHMRISKQDMALMQYYNLDFVTMLFGRIGLAILILSCVVFKLVSYFLDPLNLRLTVPVLL
ncbi:UDP-glycosyltransferase UGT5 [Drosophila grimshawi]|uniref:GH18173 n=1 Tax=Drosophila grimshawi TaxID=7222 RepID=B4JG61_DROGR|nr:UDP-glycosyltransferase UGT5 [Drosophila grimshawi]EDV93628.1 GH18173 [Drosophila grimshawi]